MEERNQRASFQGIVISTKMDKTIVVLVETYRKHAKYGKRVKYAKKYYVHDEKNKAKVNDVVTIMGTKPISKTKRFRLVSIDKKALAEIKVDTKELNVEEKLAAVKEAEAKEAAKKAAAIEAEHARLREEKEKEEAAAKKKAEEEAKKAEAEAKKAETSEKKEASTAKVADEKKATKKKAAPKKEEK